MNISELEQKLKKEKEEIMWSIKCLAEDNINDFIDNRCNENDKSKYTAVKEFRQELQKSYGWISQKIIAKTMRELGFNSIRIYYNGKQRRCYIGLDITRSIGDINNNIMQPSSRPDKESYVPQSTDLLDKMRAKQAKQEVDI
jgi:hypothetical protein